MQAEDSSLLNQRLVDYILEHGDDLAFTKNFWRECEPLPIDIAQYSKFAQALSFARQGLKGADIASRIGVNRSSVYSWVHHQQMPKLGHFLRQSIRLGPPSEHLVWLTIEQSQGYGIPLGRFIQVPIRIQSWKDVEAVVNQLAHPIERLENFNKYFLFGFLIGMLIGDASKSKQGHSHRHIGLVLSKKYDTNLSIGDFTCLCAQSFGLRMHRAKDQEQRVGKPHGFYEWTSQASPFIDWLYHVALGLRDGELTTYDAVHLDWAIDAPLEFRVGLIQGIAESDGSVSIASQAVEFWIIPNWDFLIRLLATFGLSGFRNREAVTLSKSQAIASFQVPVFSAHLESVRYQRLRVLATTPRLERQDRVPSAIRERIVALSRDGLSVPEIIETIADTDHLLISFEAGQRWANKSGPESSTDETGKELDSHRNGQKERD